MAPRRRLLLFIALALTLLAVFTVDRNNDPETPAQRESRSQQSRPTPATETTTITPADLERPRYTAASGDLFPTDGGTLPAAMPTALPNAPPPLPFTYLGKLLEGKETVVFLLYQDRTLAVRRADVIDGTYRVEQIMPQSMALVYLPLKQEQSLDFAGAN